ncbi:MAG TPA: BON domain-containing protein [Polyangiaceae bacterium]|nr:BON domain-containing protein [Polyangiaceae bacterium]
MPLKAPAAIVPSIPRGPALTDRDISAAIRWRLEHDPGVDASGVTVRVSQGIVELTGSVSSLLSKGRTVRVAEAVKGVRAVSDRLELLSDLRPDHDLEVDVVAALSAAQPASLDTTVVVQGGHVTLRGTAASYQQRALWGWTAEAVRGVQSVDNQVRVRSVAPRQDADIRTDVVSRLRWDVLVNDEHIAVSVSDGKVTLRGEVASAAERRRAGIDAWVLGVSDVDESALRVAAWRPDLLRHELFAQSDEAIAKAIRDAASYDPRVSAADINPEVEASYVVLRGSVGSVSARRAAEELARNTVGVLFVENLLEVRPLESPPDPQLAEHVRQALSRNPYTHGLPIIVAVRAGTVTLRGTVDTAFERAEATTIAASIEGARDIDNQIGVVDSSTGYVYHSFFYPYGPYAEGWYALPTRALEPDPRLREAVVARLESDPFVDAKAIRVTVTAARATLTGEVRSYRERMAATESAYEAGALAVDNQLQVVGSGLSERLHPRPQLSE